LPRADRCSYQVDLQAVAHRRERTAIHAGTDFLTMYQ
jgi:hypothetical protein